MKGQCNNSNDGIGNWYSLDALGQCGEGESVGEDNCSWKLVGINKTITAACLQSLGFWEACAADEKLPFPTAVKIFQNAFLFNNSSSGGCPPVNQASTILSGTQNSPIIAG